MSSSISLKNKSKLIRHEVSKYLSKKGYSCHYEVGLNKWGKARADVFAFNYKRNIVVVEVKSSWTDYKNDTKWQTYLPYSNQFYFAVAQDFPLKPEFLEALKSQGAGLLVINLDSFNVHKYHSGSIKCLLSAKTRPMEGSFKRDIIVRIAFRNGLLRTNKNNWLNQVKDLT